MIYFIKKTPCFKCFSELNMSELDIVLLFRPLAVAQRPSSPIYHCQIVPGTEYNNQSVLQTPYIMRQIPWDLGGGKVM